MFLRSQMHEGQRFIIKVTAQDIEEGIPAKPDCCPVALAVKKVIDVFDLTVEAGTIELEDYDCVEYEAVIVTHGQRNKLEKFVIDFDNHEQVLPFEFEFYVSEKEQEYGESHDQD